MKELIRRLLMLVMVMSLVSCGGRQTMNDDDLVLDDSGASAPADSASADSPASAAGDDDFAEFEGEEKPADPKENQEATAAADEDELNIEDEPQEAAPPAEQAQQSKPDPAADPALNPEPPVEITPTPAPAPEEQQVQVPETTPEPTPEPEPAPSPSMASSETVTITSLKYKANDNGGTVLIEANGPIAYTTRSNPELRQLIVEVPNAILPKKLQRPLNTRDIQGSIGAIDPYQNSGSNVARFVIQLREGAQDPVVQQEGNTLLVVANAPAPKEEEPLAKGESPVNVDLNDGRILTSQSLSDFLSGNTKFYGKKVSLEMSNMDVREALRFITEESGVNMVIAEEVKGSVSLKLRQVPWDQALVTIMKAKRLGYTRQGNVLRIAPIDQLKQEEDDATKLAQSKKGVEALKVRLYPISYAQVADLEKKIAGSGFLSERGKVVGDVRTNSLVVTDIEDNLLRVSKLIQSLDTQPPQVLIEGKIVEANESFSRAVGVNWGFGGQDINLGNGASGPVNLRPSMSSSPTGIAGNAMRFDLALGVLDGFGDLTATLALNERESKVKVISSPRIVTLSNETANITQTTEVPVRQVTINGTQSQETFSFKPLTMKLEVLPQITADSSIIMKVGVKREFRGAAANASNEAFSVNAREANTKVLVRNGQTAVIGGIYQSDATEGESGVPFLREIPFVGALFRGRTATRDKLELLIFLTPRVLAQAESGTATPPPATGGDL